MSRDINTEALNVARHWLGTPYRHQGATRGAGCDCLGLIRGIWRSLYGTEPEPVPPYTRDWAERGTEERLWRAALRHMRPVQYAAPGQVILFRMHGGLWPNTSACKAASPISSMPTAAMAWSRAR